MWSSLDAVWCVLLWLLLVGARVSLVLTRGEEAGAFQPSLVEPSTIGGKLILHLPGLQLFMYCISTSVLVVASFWQIRTSHAMLLIVNAWSAALLGGSIAGMQAKKQWRRVSGLFRKTSRAFELCFAALCATIVFLTLSVLYDLRQGRGIEVLASIAVAFFIPGVLWTHASTTTACNRLPSLVMLCDAEDEEEDQQYMDLAMFLSLSECGFFAWDTCVTIGLVHKFLYFMVAVAGTIGFQTGAFNLQQITGS